MKAISLKFAKSYILEHQLLSETNKLKGVPGALDVIKQLGYLQIDTISVVARAHHHILYSRVVDYLPEYLEQLEHKRAIFEYWSHAASYLPMQDFRFSLYQKEKIKAGEGHWRKRDEKWMKWVYDQIKSDGPKMGRDFKKDKNLSYDHAWGGHPVNQALRQLFMEGEIMVAGRKGFQKIFDLKENVLPDEVDTSLPTEDDYFKYLIIRDIKANGLMKAREIGHLITIPKARLHLLLNELMEAGIIQAILIEKLGTESYYTIKDRFEKYQEKPIKKRVTILSPFDNLLIQRKRTKELFDFDYTLECYVTAAKRKVGYFSLPVLYGSNLVGQVDLKADRKKKVLIVKNLVWEKNTRITKSLQTAFDKALKHFRDFNGCREIEGV